MKTIDNDVLEQEVGPAPVADMPIIDETAADVRGRIIKILSSKKSQTAKYARVASEVTACLQRRGKFYFHAENRDFDSAMYFDQHEKVLTPVRNDRFKSWLSLWTATNRADQLFRFMLADVENVALSSPESSPIIPERFWASREGAIYLSCGDGQSVKITGKEIKLVDNGHDDVLFACGSTLALWELAAPVDPFESCTIFRDTACTAPHGKDLLRVFIMSLPTNPKSKPPLVTCGDVGSGKTRICKAIAEFYGMPAQISKVDESKEPDFWAAIDQGGLLTLDNADTRIKWLPDAIASAATDGCKVARRLYTNSETVIQRARSWLAITSAMPSFASDAGLADRLLVVRMNRRHGTTADDELSNEIRVNRDSGLSHVSQVLSTALSDRAEIPGDLNSRHPDFARFAVRIGRAIGRETEVIIALRAAEADKARFCLENDTIGAALLATIPQEPFQGTATQLLERLRGIDPDIEKVSAKRLSKRLALHWPHIEGVFQANRQVVHGGALEYELKAKR